MTARAAEPARVGDVAIPAGHARSFEIPVARLPTGTWVSLPVTVLHGRAPGPRIWLSGAVHGDELNGVEIIRRVIEVLDPRTLAGTVVAVPVVNVFGFVARSRYLPDRRDLNRAFPGAARGSLAGRLAHLFMREIVEGSALGIDYHTGSDNRTNLPQVRADLTDDRTAAFARAFGAPVTIHAATRDGSLREAALERGIGVLLYEGGEPMRFNQEAIVAGVEGTLRVMAALGMRSGPDDPAPATVEASRTVWVRARRSGVVRLSVGLGARVARGADLGVVADVTGRASSSLRAPSTGIVIGLALSPLASQGDALVHIARLERR